MKICILSEHYFPKIGGTSIYTHEITTNIARINKSNRIFLITPSLNHSKNVLNQKNIIQESIQIPKFLKKERYLSIFLSLKLLKVCLREKIDVIHVSYGFFSIIFATLIAKLLRKKIVFTIQNVPPEEHSKLKGNIIHKLYLRLVKIFGYFTLNLPYHKLICVSNHTANLAKKRGVDSKKIVVIPNGISSQFFAKTDKSKIRADLRIPENEIIILNVAGLIKHKGQAILVKAFKSINEKVPNTTLIFIGPVRDKRYIDEIKDLNEFKLKSNKILFLGTKNHSDLPAVYQMADIYVQPSLQEGFCISILEAMASSLPVIGTNVGAIPEFIGNSKRGILIKDLTPKVVETQILKLIHDEKLRDKISKMAPKFVGEHYLWKEIANRTYNLYENLMSS